MFMMEALPPGEAASAEKAARDALNVPNVSISRTVRNPLELSCSAAARKLPAAQFMRIDKEPNRDVAPATIFSQSTYDLTSPWSGNGTRQ